MKSLLALVLLAFAPPSAFAATSAEILHGTGLRWGMTEVQIEQALHAKVVHGEAHMWDEYSVPVGAFDGLPTRYVLSFSIDKTLSELTLIIDQPSTADQQVRFGDLRAHLEAWYGTPVAASKRDGNDDVVYTVWTPGENKLELGSGTDYTTRRADDVIIVEKRITSEAAVTVSAKSIAALAEDDVLKIRWAGMPVFVVKRSAKDLQRLQGLSSRLPELMSGGDSSMVQSQSFQRPLSLNEPFTRTVYRSVKPEVGVYLSMSTYEGCALLYKDLSAEPEVQGIGLGFYDPCHGHSWDIAGWPEDEGPGVTPLAIPKYHYEVNGDLVIGR
jgi:Rieske Fe-S protein